MELKRNRPKNCCGLCDIDVCKNTDCDIYKKLEEKELMKIALESAAYDVNY